MRVPWRRERVPESVRSRVELADGERVLAAAPADTDGHALATVRALYLIPADPAADVVRLRWDLIDLATWDPPLLAMDVRADADSAPDRLVVDLGMDSEVPAVVRDRVTNSILVNSGLDVPGGSARVVARRNPDDGLLVWRVSFGAGVDPADPAVQAAAEARLRELRAGLGV